MNYNKVNRLERVIQFGEGGFLRGFADWILQHVNEKSGFNGSAVVVQPTIKISTNAQLVKRKSNWIDFDASPVLDGKDLKDELFSYILR